MPSVNPASLSLLWLIEEVGEVHVRTGARAIRKREKRREKQTFSHI